jgi:DNA-binding MarR family transcriptional regulator
MSNEKPDEPRWLSAEEMAAWLPLAGVMELLPAYLDSQMRRDADLTQFEYYVLAMLSEADAHTLRMTALATRTSATLPRLSHVVRRLADKGLVEKFPCPGDGRATNVRLTDAGWAKVEAAAPQHVAHVRAQVFDVLDAEQVAQLTHIAGAILSRLDPDGSLGPETASP